ncbi:hypothetical protein F66182_10242 [Fusarium sp. NRRL 66182]|nr:hypothetical protein F66182_10242 [Fusarium sp. NRRL 66182]
MLQRGGTYVISVDKGIPLIHKDMPIGQVEKESLEGLTKAGFLLDSGPDGAGLVRKFISRGGGYYIDAWCSQLIIDGKVKVSQIPNGIKEFVQDGIVLADGSKLEADLVVPATSYDGMKSTARKLLGDKAADRTRETWHLDEQGEIRSMWRSSGHPHFWFTGGSLALCSSYSRLLALRIKAVEEGLLKQ